MIDCFGFSGWRFREKTRRSFARNGSRTKKSTRLAREGARTDQSRKRETEQNGRRIQWLDPEAGRWEEGAKGRVGKTEGSWDSEV